ncbi:Vgb family protein, partial [Streptomyces solincola]
MSSLPAPRITEFTVTDEKAGPYGVAAGPDHALWLTLVHRGAVARLDPEGGSFREFPLDAPGCGPTVIAAGPDGALWFSRTQDHRIGRITPDGAARSFPLPTPGAVRAGGQAVRAGAGGGQGEGPCGS